MINHQDKVIIVTTIKNWIQEEKFEIIVIICTAVIVFIFGELIKEFSPQHKEIAPYLVIFPIGSGIVLGLIKFLTLRRKVTSVAYQRNNAGKITFLRIVLLISSTIFLYSDLFITYLFSLSFFRFADNQITPQFLESWNLIIKLEIIMPILALLCLWCSRNNDS